MKGKAQTWSATERYKYRETNNSYLGATITPKPLLNKSFQQGHTTSSAFFPGDTLRPNQGDGSTTVLLHGNKTFKVWTERIITEGTFGRFCPGQDVEKGVDVLVKIYRDTGNLSAKCFQRTFDALININRKLAGGRLEGGEQDLELLAHDLDSMGGGSRYGSASFIVSQMEFKHSFVDLLDHSRDSTGKPGLDAESGLYFIVQEMGEVTLRDEILGYVTEGRNVPLSELRKLQWDLVSIVCSLHSQGLVNLDIAPGNIMKYRTKDGQAQWRLIDFDGSVQPEVGMSRLEVPIVPEYMPPEFASQYLQARREPCKLKALRNMDVWSAGLCGMEPILLKPVLGGQYHELRARTGSDTRFLAWLSSDGLSEAVMSTEIHDEVKELDEDMCDLLEGMLLKDHTRRFSITHCLTHRFFMPFQRLILEASWDSGLLQSIDDAEAALKKQAEDEELQKIIEETKHEREEFHPHSEAKVNAWPEEPPPPPPPSNSKVTKTKSCVLM